MLERDNMTETVSDKFKIFLEYVERHAIDLRAHRAYGWMSKEMLEEIERLERENEVLIGVVMSTASPKPKPF
jgi:uncharacterized protein YdaT